MAAAYVYPLALAALLATLGACKEMRDPALLRRPVATADDDTRVDCPLASRTAPAAVSAAAGEPRNAFGVPEPERRPAARAHAAAALDTAQLRGGVTRLAAACAARPDQDPRNAADLRTLAQEGLVSPASAAALRALAARQDLPPERLLRDLAAKAALAAGADAAGALAVAEAHVAQWRAQSPAAPAPTASRAATAPSPRHLIIHKK